MKKTCLFLEDVYDGETLVWQKFFEYEVIDEDKKGYYFMINDAKWGISHEYKDKKFILIQREFETK